MNTIKTSALIFTGIVACLMLLLTPDSQRVGAPTGEVPSAGLEAAPMKRQQSEYLVESMLPVVPVSDESLPVTRETSESSVTAPIATQSIDWQKVLYPELARISELEHKSTDTALAELVPMLASDDPAVRRAAIEAVGDMTIPTVLPILSMALGDPSPQVRVVALEALASQDDETVADNIEPYLYDQDPEVRLAAIDALAALEAKTAVYALASLLSDPEISIRRHAVSALGDIGGKNAMTYLLQARYDPEPDIRINAGGILMEMEFEAAN